jgi:pSer/pThr/pTyr-binding forkhead associated (FHA) protein
MYCTNCGHKNPEGANFCSSCGSPLTDRQADTTVSFLPSDSETDFDEEIHISPEELEGGRGVLIVKRGPNAGSKFFMDEDRTQIGRHPDSLHDVGSLNGTYVNRERVEDADLRSGDEIQIGKFKLVFLTGS